MSQRAGWYDDPENPENLRYFDGVVWTSHTTPRAAPSTPPTQQLPQQPPGSQGQPGQPPAYGSPPQYGQQPPYSQQQYGQQQPYPPGQPYGQPPAYGPPGAYGSMPPAYSGALSGPTTPDGAPLASYGQRVGAYLLDYLIISVVALIASSYWLYQFFQWYIGYISDLVQQTETGRQPTVDQNAIQDQVLSHIWPVAIVSILVHLIYNTFFLTRTGATPGMMALGITVRLRERPGPLKLVDALKRQVIDIGAGVLGFVPLVSVVATLGLFLNLLWPLWDDKRQALHDKIAGTNVVVKRRER